MIEKTFYIKGMQCQSCAMLISQELEELSGVKKVKVDLQNNSALITFEGEMVSLGILQAKLKDTDFLINDAPFKNSKSEWLYSILIAAVFVAAFIIIQDTEIMKKLPAISNNYSLISALLIGFAASCCSCLALVGSIVMAFMGSYSQKQKLSPLKINLLFHFGRILAFLLGGMLLGLIGAQIALSYKAAAILNFIAAGIIFALGLNLLGIGKSIFSFIKIPVSLTLVLDKLKGLSSVYVPTITGAMTLFLPCGFALSMMILAVNSGNYLTGGLIMMMFALGTLPVLFVIGMTACLVKNKNLVLAKKIIGAVIIAFAVMTARSALALVDTAPTNSTVAATTAQSEPQVVEMHINYNSFEPRVIKLKKDSQLNG